MIGFVICGVEHSGTTLVSDLFRQSPEMDSGFEVGVLLASSPRRFTRIWPYASNILQGWDITEDNLRFCCDTDCFELFYSRLRDVSRALAPAARIFDKTPRYMAYLDSCLRKVRVPFVVTYKDPRAIAFSDFRRSGHADFDPWFEGYAPEKLGYLQQLYAQYRKSAPNRRVLRVSLEHLCLHPREACEQIFAHCGEAFSLRYLLFAGSKFLDHTTASISPRTPFEYLGGLTDRQARSVARSFAALEEWFYE